jgi:hypothetical protein
LSPSAGRKGDREVPFRSLSTATPLGRSRMALCIALPLSRTGCYLPSSFLHRDLAACRRALVDPNRSFEPGVGSLLAILSPRRRPRRASGRSA